MNRIVHVSDLHFGAHEPELEETLLADIAARTPDVVAVSGDLTQRARRRQFRAARAWLDRLPAPWVAVPGNHDIPLYDVWRRFMAPMRRFKRYVCPTLSPFHGSPGIAVLGLNTARSLTFKDGRLSLLQIAMIQRRFARQPEGTFRVVVAHHPFVRPEGQPRMAIVGRADVARRALEAAKVDLVLAGHVHVGYTSDLRRHYADARRSILVAQAGTAMSFRRRGEPNAYNVLDVSADRVVLEVRTNEGGRFVRSLQTTFERPAQDWREVDRVRFEDRRPVQLGIR